MTKTIKDHMNESDQVKKLVDESNALLSRARDELVCVREVIIALRDYQHPKLIMAHRTTSHFANRVADCGDRDFSPAHLIDKQIQRINALLGDRP